MIIIIVIITITITLVVVEAVKVVQVSFVVATGILPLTAKIQVVIAIKFIGKPKTIVIDLFYYETKQGIECLFCYTHWLRIRGAHRLIQ